MNRKSMQMMKQGLVTLLGVAAWTLGSSACQAQIYTGHDSVPRLRGAMVAPTISSSDTTTLASWGANVARYQLVYYGLNGADIAHFNRNDAGNDDYDIPAANEANYQSWLTYQVTNSASALNTFVANCAANNIKVVIDLHTPPGGYCKDSTHRIFMFNDCYQDFLNDWQMIATHFAGNAAVWGYDLCNEPIDTIIGTPPPVPGVHITNDWNAVALAAAQVVRQYDYLPTANPQHAIIVEDRYGDASKFASLNAITTVPGIVYSTHMYYPTSYTFQGLGGTNPVAGTNPWPYTSGATTYNVAALATWLQTVRDWQSTHNNPQIYIGEFSATRWNQGTSEYLNELINLFESYGWDWTYHAFRESDVWDAEMGLDPNKTDPNYVSPITYSTRYATTDRKTLLMNWFANNPTSLTNYSFESPSVGTGSTAYVYVPTTATPWTFTSGGGIAGNGSAFSNPTATTGTQVAFLQNTSKTSEAVTWTPNCSYTVTFNAAQRPSTLGGQTLNVYVGGTLSGGTLSGATLVGTVTPSGTSWASYTVGPFTVGTGTSGVSRLLTFVGTVTGDHTAFVENVTISGVPPQIMNPSFEFTYGLAAAGNSTPYTTPHPTTSAWTFSNSGIAANGSSWCNGTTLAPNGTQIGYMQGASAVVTSQPINNLVANGTAYQLTVSADQWWYNATLGSNDTINVSLDSTLLSAVTPTTSFGDYNLPFTTTTGTHTVKFAGSTANSQSAGLIDNVRLVVTTPTVP